MIIDIHTHTFPDHIAPIAIQKLQGMSHTRAFVDGTQAGLQASMAQSGVDRCLVLPVATNAKQVPRVNESSAQVNACAQETGILSFGCMHPDYPDWKEELSRIAQLGLKGIKLHPLYQDTDIDDPRYLRILERAAEVGLLVLSHAGLDVGFPGQTRCSPRMIRHALDEVGQIPMILAHMGGWRNWDEVEQYLSDTNVYLDTSFALGKLPHLNDGYYPSDALSLMSNEQFLRLVRTFGIDHILFGTDSPWGGQPEQLFYIRSLPFTPEEEAAILGGNAQRLLQL